MIFDRWAKVRRCAAAAPAVSHVVRARGRRGFTLLEVIVAIGVIAVLMGFILAAVTRTRTAAQGSRCAANLHSISVALTQAARDHADYFPDPVALNESWEQSIAGYISNSAAFQCPSDNEVYPAVGSSYDWRDTGVYATTLAGRTVHDVNRTTAVLTFESLPGWHASQRINAAFVDCSVQTMDQSTCLSDLQTPIRK